MASRAVRGLSFLVLLLTLLAPPALAQQSREVVTTKDSDYFGFDLRSERDVTQDQCEAVCLAENTCRAFTYNVKAKWCFLKSDFNQIKPFKGAVAGKVVNVAGDPDIGAPPEIAFFPTYMADEARQYRTSLLANTVVPADQGLAGLIEQASEATRNSDPRTAMNRLVSAVALSPDDGNLWTALASSMLIVSPVNSQETYSLQRDAGSAIWNAYQLQRTTKTRAEALLVMARVLDKRDLYRPSLQAYEASLALEANASVQAEYQDLKARKGFRIINHTVEADTSNPRICAQFSEDLVKAGVDYAPFVTVDNAAPKSVEAKDRQICVEGLEHGKHYSVAFRQGLPAAIGEVLEAPATLSIYMQDRPASARFTGDSFVLPAGARHGIPLVTVNMTEADIKLYRVNDRSLAQLLSGYSFLKQVDGYSLDNIADQLGEAVWEGKIEVANELNKEVTTSFPVDEALPERKPGVYVMTAQAVNSNSEYWDSRATQWFVVSDIGLTTYTGQDGLNVFARSLGTAKPIADAELTLLAKNNEILGTAKTDAEGRATFNPGMTRGKAGLVPAVLMANSATGQDFVFLDMNKAGFDLSDRGVEGRTSPGALDIYAWTERGIYRVGETVHVAALARDDSANAVEKLPLTFVFRRPDGVEDRRIVADGATAGGYAVELPVSSNAMRGTWSVAIYTDPKKEAVTSQSFLVEDFVPDRIEFDLTAPKKEITVGEEASVEVDGRFLYGAPAAGLQLEGEMKLATTREWDRFKGYVFGLADEQPGDATSTPLNAPVVGEDGKASIPIIVDSLPSTTRLVNAGITVRMREGAGRAVERSTSIAVQPQADMIGLKAGFNGEEVPEGATASFNVIAADPSGQRKAMPGLQWSLLRIERNYQWYRSGSSWNYEPVTFTRSVSNGTVDVAADGEAKISVPVEWGRYRLEVETADPSGPTTSFEFDAGWYVETTSTETPDGLEIALDKDKYAAGEVAKLNVSPRFAGEMLVTIGAERLLKTISATIPEGGATIDIPVDKAWGAGAYVTATLFKPGNGPESRMPARAIGVSWLQIDPKERKLEVKLDTPEKTVPRQPLTIPVQVTGAAPLADAYVTVAAVDVGILNLTKYEAPDPEKWYFGQRMLGIEIRDLYGRLINGSLGAAGKLRTGGDGGGLTPQGSPPTEKLVAFFEGPVKLDADGKASVSFDIPQFNGTVRVMAVAWTKDAVGHGVSDVIVRDPVVITAGYPRFMAPGDTARLRLDIANTDAPDGDYAFSVETTGDLSTGSAALPEKVSLAAGKRSTLTVPLLPQKVGNTSVTVRLSKDGGPTVEQTLYIPVRPAQLPVTTRMVVDLGPNGQSLRIDRELLAASLVEGASVSVGVTPSAAFDVPSLLMTLDRYPYGCAEQTTSRALPLLYVSELTGDAGMRDDPELKERIQQAIYRVLNYQSSSGSFGLWSPGSGDLWLDSYVTDFLTRAREKNFNVPTQAMLNAVNNLQNSIGYDVDVEDRGTEIAYALYVLARNKKASIGDLRYYTDTKLEAFSSPMAVAQLAAALSLYGDSQRANETFQAAVTLAKSKPEYDWYRSDYGSKLRDGAAILALAAESTPQPPIVPELIKQVADERNKLRWTSTQDEAWMLLAARALKANDGHIALDINGTAHKGSYSTRIEGADLIANPLVIANTGTDPIQAVVTTVAAPSQPLPAGGDGFSIERTYYKMDGSEVNVTEAAQNERYVVVLNVTETNAWSSRVLVTDLLPAGFEIDNPGLVNSASLTNFPWLADTQAAHLEFRDDRFVAAFDRYSGAPRTFSLAYVVRAVTPGAFAHPAASVEDMYRPQYSARTATGMMEITGQ